MEYGAQQARPERGGGPPEETPSDRARWTAAISYAAFLCFAALWRSGKDPFIRFHAQQGFLLFLAECVVIATAIILELTVGRLRFFGIVVVGLFELAAGIGALTLSVLGFTKALFGEYWHLPVLGEYRERIPALHREER